MSVMKCHCTTHINHEASSVPLSKKNIFHSNVKTTAACTGQRGGGRCKGVQPVVVLVWPVLRGRDRKNYFGRCRAAWYICTVTIHMSASRVAPPMKKHACRSHGAPYYLTGTCAAEYATVFTATANNCVLYLVSKGRSHLHCFSAF